MSGARLTVLMVSDVYFPRINGVSTSIETFRRALVTHGVDVRLVVPRYSDEPDEAGIFRVPGRAVPGDPEDRLVQWRAMHQAVAIAAADCDLVHVHTPFVAHYAGVEAARHHRRAVLLTYHTFFEEYLHHYAPLLPGTLLRTLARRVSRSQCNAVDAVVVPSQAMRERLLGYGTTTPLHVLPTGIPLQAFANAHDTGFRERHAIAEDAPLALYVGRLAHEKNLSFLLDVAARAARRLPRFVLAIAGQGPAVASLRAQAHRAGLDAHLRFIGYLDRNHELPACYACADAFAFASRTETQGLVLLEAMASGLPVVALAAMGTHDILAAGRGTIAPPDDPEAFSDALVGLLSDPTRRQRMSADARAHASEWADEAMACRLAALYRQLAAR